MKCFSPILCLIISLIVPNTNFSQKTHLDDSLGIIVCVPFSLDTIEAYPITEIMPEFPGGTAEMYTFLNKNITYPQVSFDNGVQSKVIVNFIVLKDGTIADVK